MSRCAWMWVATALLLGACGGDDNCPSGLTRVGGRCVSPGDGDADADADGDGDADVDCGEAEPVQVWVDDDGDGYGVDGSETLACAVGDGQADQGEDCDDADAFVHPDAAERCNAEDDDCDEAPDDGLGCVAGLVSDCQTECGSTGVQTCSDACIPSACAAPEETCNHVDDDCDGLVDEDLQGWLGDPVAITDNANRQLLPVVAWTGTDLAIGWGRVDTVTQERTVWVRKFDLDGAPTGPEIQVAQTEEIPEAADLAALGDLSILAYATESERDVVSDPVVALTPLAGDGGPVPLPLAAAGDMEAFSNLEVLATQDDGMIVSMLTPYNPPNELRIAKWSFDPIGETHSLSFSDLAWADVDLAPNGDLFVSWAVDGEMNVGRYDASLTEVEAPRVVTDTGGDIGGGFIASVGDGALLVYGNLSDNALHALPLEEDLTPGTVVDDVGIAPIFPDGVSSSGTDVLVVWVDYEAGQFRSTRLGPDGTLADGPTDVAPESDLALPRLVWAGDRWALVYLDVRTWPDADVWVQTYGCP